MKHRAIAVAIIAASLASCGESEPEPPPPDPTPVEGVFGVAAPLARGVPSVVSLATSTLPDLTAEDPEIDQFGLQFTPERVITHVGQGVVFHNSESLTHNVTVRPVAGGVDLLNEDMPPDGSFTLTFDEAGGFDVVCDVHPGMTAFIFVTADPYAAFAEDDGSFHLTGIPPGEYTLHVWSVDESARSSTAITVREGTATEVTGAPLG